jgi:cystathionine gamma-lyase
MSSISSSDLLDSLTPQTKLIWLESPTNPLLVLPPLELISSALRTIPEEHRPLVVVDNTFLSPYWSNPLELGADVVLHSLSKYLNGHSDVIMGALVVRKGLEGKLAKGLRFLQNSS